MQQRTENNRGGWTDLTRERILFTMGSQGGLFLRSILIHQEMLSGKNSREKYSLCSGQEVGPWLVHSDFSNGKERGKRWEGMSWSKGELLG